MSQIQPSNSPENVPSQVRAPEVGTSKLPLDRDVARSHTDIGDLRNCTLTPILGDYGVWSETAQLRRVILGNPVSGVNYDPLNAPPIDRLTRQTQLASSMVAPSKAIEEFLEFRRVLERQGVTVVSPRPISGAYNQIFTRDIGIVIGDTFVPASMKHFERAIEIAAITNLIADAVSNCKAIACTDDHDAHFEGGDIIVHDGKIFVGISERTNYAGARWLQRSFPQFAVVPIELVSPTGDHEALHLDCAFTPIGDHENQSALISSHSIGNFDQIRGHFRGWDIIEITLEEQAMLGANALSVNPRTPIIRNSCERILRELTKRRFSPIPLALDSAATLGGFARCCSLPTLRG